MRYYEESQGDSDKNRYVYNRVGDFPIVQLKKNEIKRNLVRSPSVRIAPPSKTIMNRDIRAAILRSNSFQLGSGVPKLLPTKMRAKDDSHQIIRNHEPLPSLSESPQSSKSVLDALEKNCRKRINNEELTLDRNKRICATQEVVDAPSYDFVPITQQSGKRGRDQISPNKNSGDSPNSQLSKRSRIRNNALLSSLSSSAFLVKPFQPRSSSPPLKATLAPTVTSLQLKFTDEDEAEKHIKEVEVEKEAEKSPPKPEPVKRLHLFNRKIDPATFRPSIAVSDDDDEDKISFVKPRETKSNTNVDIARHIEKDKLAMMLSGLSDNFTSPTKEAPKDSVDSAPASISFTTSTTSSTVAPISSPTSSNPLLSLSVSQSSSSILASAVKPTEPIVSTSVASTEIPKAAEVVKPSPSFQFGNTPAAESTVVTTATSLPTLIVPPASTAVPAMTTAPAERVSPLAIFTTPKQAEAAALDQSKPLISFTPIRKDLNASVAPIASLATSSVEASTAASTHPVMSKPSFSFGANKEPEKPSGGGFSFGNNITFGTTPQTVAQVSAHSAVASTPATTSPPSFSFQASKSNTFSFGAKPSNVTSAAPTNASGGLQNTFSSGTGALTSTVSFMEKPATTTASGIGFSFNNTSAIKPVAPTTTPGQGFSFGSNQSAMNATNQSVMNAAPVTTSSSTFSFGASNSSSMFGQQQSQNQAPTQQPSFPSFAQKTEAPSGMFSFGQKAAEPVAAAPSFSFGGASQVATTQQPSSQFNFNQSSTLPSANDSTSGSIFSRLGDKSGEAKPAFSFGGNNQNQAPQANVVSPFGTNSNNSQVAPFNTINSSFNQPAPSSNSIFGGNQSQINDFGGNVKPANSSGSMFAFGASSSQPPQQQPQVASNMFSFGGQSAQQTTSGNSSIFNGTSGQNVSASFTFKPSSGAVTNSNSSPNLFGQNQNQNSMSSGPPAYQFGGQVGSNVSTSYTFGGATANSAQQSSLPSNGFNFSGPQTAPVAGGFNFQAASQPTLTPQPSSGGLFSIGTGGNQQRRPIRQATRRMK